MTSKKGRSYDVNLTRGQLFLVDQNGVELSMIVRDGVDVILKNGQEIDVLLSSGERLLMRPQPDFSGNFVQRCRNGIHVLYFPNDDFVAAAAAVCGVRIPCDGIIFRNLYNCDATGRCVQLDLIQKSEMSATIVVHHRTDLDFFTPKSNLEFVVLDDIRDFVPCHMYMLCVNSFGDIFVCCRQLRNLVIGNLREADISDKVLVYSPNVECICDKAHLRAATIEEQIRGPLSLTIELAGECNGNCTYCFQRYLPTFKKPFKFYEELESFVYKLGIKYVTVLGGEVSVQQKTIELLERFAKNHVRIAIVTNGAVPVNVEERLVSVAEDFLITFNGFSEKTVGLLSNLPFQRQLEFCERVVSMHKRVSVRFLVTPITLVEIPDFLRWASLLPFDHILLDVAVNTPIDYMETGKWGSSSLKSIDMEFWASPLARIGESAKDALRRGASSMAKCGLSLIICEEISDLLGLDLEFMREINAENRLVPKRSYISNKAWVKYWRQNSNSTEKSGGD